MQNATRYLAYTFVLSYLLCVLYVWSTEKTFYQGTLHLQLSVLSLGLGYLVGNLSSNQPCLRLFSPPC
ncbi:MAG: hypothetical protein U5L01_16270 [Rheinheimera sp.]|nr:hypothetical protein [Rheinheimera sp.]